MNRPLAPVHNHQRDGYGQRRMTPPGSSSASSSAVIGEAVELLREGPPSQVALSDKGLVIDATVVTLASTDRKGLEQFSSSLVEAIAQHRHFGRELGLVPA